MVKGFRTSASCAGRCKAREAGVRKASQGGNRVQEKALAPLVRSMGFEDRSLSARGLEAKVDRACAGFGIKWPAYGRSGISFGLWLALIWDRYRARNKVRPRWRKSAAEKRAAL